MAVHDTPHIGNDSESNGKPGGSDRLSTGQESKLMNAQDEGCRLRKEGIEFMPKRHRLKMRSTETSVSQHLTQILSIRSHSRKIRNFKTSAMKSLR